MADIDRCAECGLDEADAEAVPALESEVVIAHIETPEDSVIFDSIIAKMTAMNTSHKRSADEREEEAEEEEIPPPSLLERSETVIPPASIASSEKKQMNFGLQPSIPLIELAFDDFETRNSRYLIEVQREFIRLAFNEFRPDRHWEHYKLKTPIDSVFFELFLRRPDSFMAIPVNVGAIESCMDPGTLYRNWSGFEFNQDLAHLNNAPRSIEIILDTLIAQCRNVSFPSIRFQRVRYLLTYVREMIKEPKRLTTHQWMMFAVFIFQQLTNLLARDATYFVSRTSEYNMEKDHQFCEGGSTYYYQLSHFVFELIAEWTMDYRVPAILLRPKFCYGFNKNLDTPALYLPYRNQIVDEGYVDCAMDCIANHLANFSFDVSS